MLCLCAMQWALACHLDVIGASFLIYCVYKSVVNSVTGKLQLSKCFMTVSINSCNSATTVVCIFCSVSLSAERYPKVKYPGALMNMNNFGC